MRISIVTRLLACRPAALLVVAGLVLIHPRAAVGQSSSKSDPLDPANYVCVSEQTTQGNDFPLFGSPETCPTLTALDHEADTNKIRLRWSAPSAEVDRGSRILIRFSREHLLLLSGVAGSIGITGTISKAGSPGSTPPIEILGYSQIGQEARPASVKIRSVADIRASMQETAEIAAGLDKLITEAISNAALQSNAFTDQSRRRDSTLRASLDSVTRSMTALRSQTDSLHLLVQPRSDSAGPDTLQVRTTMLLDLTTEQISALAKARTDILQAMSRLPKVAEQRKRFEEEANTTIREAIVEQFEVLTTLLTMLSIPSDTVAMDRLVARLGGHGPLLRGEAAVALNALKIIKDGNAPDARAMSAVEQVQRLLNKVSRLYSSDGGVADAIREDMILDIRDAMINLRASGAEPGDHIVLTITYMDDSRVSRALRLNLLVRQFGLVQHSEPSLLLLNRLGITAPPYPPADPVPGQTSERYRYRATPGFTYGWSLETRRQWGAPWFSTLVRWLDPGFGVNVSFPRFSTQLVRFEKEIVDGEGSTQTVSETDDGPDLQIGAGPMLSFFGGAVQLTMGWNLMADRDRRYFGIGFSFIDLAGKLKDGSK